MSPEQRSLRASAAAHASWARTANRSARVLPANRGLEARIAKEYGIPADLPAAEYAVRIESARRAYFRSLAAKSAKTRARRKQQGSDAA
jgi:hypothetical protein